MQMAIKVWQRTNTRTRDTIRPRVAPRKRALPSHHTLQGIAFLRSSFGPQFVPQHKCLHFLETPVVHKYMRAEWLGGGHAELTGKKERQRVLLIWMLLWPFILVYSAILQLVVAVIPPFSHWYRVRLKYHTLQTHERAYWGLPFLPCVTYMVKFGFQCNSLRNHNPGLAHTREF